MQTILSARPAAQAAKRLRVGIAGLGVAANQILPAFKDGAPYDLVAGADTRPEARAEFERRYGRETVSSVRTLCKRNDIDAVWIATPNTRHAEHAVCAAMAGKHIICEKPMAVNLRQCDRMIEAAEANKVIYLQGHSKIYQAPMKMMRDIIRSGRLGAVVQIQSTNFNDWLQRPRLASHRRRLARVCGGSMWRVTRALSSRSRSRARW